MKEMSGLEALREIKSRKPEVNVIIYTARPSFEYLVRAVESGASGFVLKDAPEDVLLADIRRIAAGETLLSADWQVSTLKEIYAKSQDVSPHQDAGLLTPREVEILQAIGKGLPTEEIAEVFSVSVHTVNTHIHNVLKKLGLEDRTQALVWAARRKLVTFD